MAGSEQQQASAEYQNETPEEQKAKVARMQFVARIVAMWSVITGIVWWVERSRIDDLRVTC
jgi:hypothetical protein